MNARMLAHAAVLPLALLAAAPLALTQSVVPLVEVGDIVPGVGAVTRIDDVDVNSSGDWIVEVDTDQSDTATDEVILENGAVQFRQGTALNIPGPAGATLSSGDRMFVTDGGISVYLLRVSLAGGGLRGIVLFDGDLVLEESVTPFNATGAPAGAVWMSISEIWASEDRQLLVGGRLSSGDDVLAQLQLDAAGAITAETILAIDGTTLPGHNAAIQGFSFTRRRNGMNASGETVWFVDDRQNDLMGNDNRCCDSWFYRNTASVLQESNAVPATGQIVGTLSSAEIDINDSGDWVAQIAQNPNTFNQDIIYLNGTTVIAAEGAGLPSLPAGQVITSLGSLAGVFLTNGGDVLYFADWDDPNTDIDTGLFRNDELLIQEGVTDVNGVLIDTIANSENTIDVSRDGAFVIAEMTLVDGTQGAYLFQFGTSISANYCSPANPNVTGLPGEISAFGSQFAADNNVELTASQLPLNSFGFFITSMQQGFVANPNGSQGNLCLGGAIGRYVGPGQIQNSGAAGEFSLVLNLPMTPQPTGFVSVAAGEMWNYQAWYRDFAGQATSNFTDGIGFVYL